jgi:hypothetical protein
MPITHHRESLLAMMNSVIAYYRESDDCDCDSTQDKHIIELILSKHRVFVETILNADNNMKRQSIQDTIRNEIIRDMIVRYIDCRPDKYQRLHDRAMNTQYDDDND